jgi:MSHA biogenesis protein MshJ
MATMRARWQWLVERFAALSARERVLVTIALFAVIYQVADLVVLQHQARQINALNTEIASGRAELRRLNDEQNVLSAGLQRDPVAKQRTAVELARQQIRQLQGQLDDATRAMISPRDMARFLEHLLSQEDALRMTRLKTLEPVPLLVGDEAGDGKHAGAASAAVHRHAFEIDFDGDFFATLRYLRTLERLPWQFAWDSIDYEVIEYPRSTVRLRLHTLSMSEDWIGV